MGDKLRHLTQNDAPYEPCVLLSDACEIERLWREPLVSALRVKNAQDLGVRSARGYLETENGAGSGVEAEFFDPAVDLVDTIREACSIAVARAAGSG